MAIPLRTMRPGRSPPIGSPSKGTASRGALSNPQTVFRNVDLPAPFAPMMATISPGAISKSIPNSAWKSP